MNALIFQGLNHQKVKVRDINAQCSSSSAALHFTECQRPETVQTSDDEYLFSDNKRERKGGKFIKKFIANGQKAEVQSMSECLQCTDMYDNLHERYPRYQPNRQNEKKEKWAVSKVLMKSQLKEIIKFNCGLPFTEAQIDRLCTSIIYSPLNVNQQDDPGKIDHITFTNNLSPQMLRTRLSQYHQIQSMYPQVDVAVMLSNAPRLLQRPPMKQMDNLRQLLTYQSIDGFHVPWERVVELQGGLLRREPRELVKKVQWLWKMAKTNMKKEGVYEKFLIGVFNDPQLVLDYLQCNNQQIKSNFTKVAKYTKTEDIMAIVLARAPGILATEKGMLERNLLKIVGSLQQRKEILNATSVVLSNRFGLKDSQIQKVYQTLTTVGSIQQNETPLTTQAQINSRLKDLIVINAKFPTFDVASVLATQPRLLLIDPVVIDDMLTKLEREVPYVPWGKLFTKKMAYFRRDPTDIVAKIKGLERAFLNNFNSKVPMRYYSTAEGLDRVLASSEQEMDDVLAALCETYGKSLARKIAKEPRAIRINALQLQNTRDFLYAKFGAEDTKRMLSTYPRVAGFTKRHINDKLAVLQQIASKWVTSEGIALGDDVPDWVEENKRNTVEVKAARMVKEMAVATPQLLASVVNKLLIKSDKLRQSVQGNSELEKQLDELGDTPAYLARILNYSDVRYKRLSYISAQKLPVRRSLFNLLVLTKAQFFKVYPEIRHVDS